VVAAVTRTRRVAVGRHREVRLRLVGIPVAISTRSRMAMRQRELAERRVHRWQGSRLDRERRAIDLGRIGRHGSRHGVVHWRRWRRRARQRDAGQSKTHGKMVTGWPPRVTSATGAGPDLGVHRKHEGAADLIGLGAGGRRVHRARRRPDVHAAPGAERPRPAGDPRSGDPSRGAPAVPRAARRRGGGRVAARAPAQRSPTIGWPGPPILAGEIGMRLEATRVRTPYCPEPRSDHRDRLCTPGE